MKNRIWVVLSVLIALCRPALAGFEASVSKSVIAEGDSFQLYLRQDGNAPAPDVSVLNKDFMVVAERKGYKSTIINGKSQSFTENVLTLIPKKTGDVVLPAIHAGKQVTKPLTLKVVPAGSGDGATGTQSNVFLRAEIKNKTPYVGQQIPLTVKLYSFIETPLLDGSLVPPQGDGVSAEPWGDAVRTRETVQGRTYDVLTYRFLLFAQKSGRLSLSPVRFKGIVSDNEPQSSFMGDDMFGFGGNAMLSGFFGQKNIVLQSNPVTLDVQAKPAGASGAWVPATAVELSEDVTPSKLSVPLGEALTRTVTVMASGVRDTQIPDVQFANGGAYRQYPGKTDSKNLFDKDGVVGVKTRQIVFIPTKAGQVTLPALDMPWFNVKTGQAETARLPARTVTVLPNPDAVATPAETPRAVEAETRPEIQPKKESAFAEAFMNPPENTAEERAAKSFWEKHARQPAWRLFLAGVLAGVAVVSALVALMYFLLIRPMRQSRAIPETARGGERFSSSVLKQACLKNSPSEAKASLLEAGRALWPHNAPLTLSELANRFDDRELDRQIEVLNKALYGDGETRWDGRMLWTVFQQAEAKRKTADKAEKIPVPPLYPD